MITSMTGFGRRQGTWEDSHVTVEIRSVNHRFLETGIRLPKSMSHLEEHFKKAIQGHCRRGRVDLTVLIQGGRCGTRSLQVDAVLAKQYHQALRTLQRTLKLKGAIDVGLLAGLRDVITMSDQPADDPQLAKLVTKLTTQAVQDLATLDPGGRAMRDIRGGEIARHGIATSPASKVSAPLVEGCVGWLECRAADEHALATKYDLFILEVVKAWIDPARKHPRTLHHQGGRSFMVAGRTIELPSRKK